MVVESRMEGRPWYTSRFRTPFFSFFFSSSINALIDSYDIYNNLHAVRALLFNILWQTRGINGPSGTIYILYIYSIHYIIIVVCIYICNSNIIVSFPFAVVAASAVINFYAIVQAWWRLLYYYNVPEERRTKK